MANAQKGFVSQNVVVTGSGVGHDALKQLVEVFFHDFPQGAPTKAASPYLGGDVRVRRDLDGVSYLGLAFPSTSSSGACFTRSMYTLIIVTY